MWSVSLAPGGAEREFIVAELWEHGTAGILEEADGGLRAFFSEEIAARTVARTFWEIASDWREEAVLVGLAVGEDWEPVYAGAKFVIVPGGKADGEDFGGRIVLEVNAAMAFGSGRHETTQLCLLALEEYLRPSAKVVDVGCGSGILALAAERLGAAMVIACDIQEDAVRTAREHFLGPLFRGSADAVDDGFADIVVSNISARVNDRIAGDLQRSVKPGGVVILSGFISENVPKSFRPVKEINRGEWLCWICTPDGIQPVETSEEVNVHSQNWF